MTENKRFQYNVNKNCIEYDDNFVAYVNSIDGFRIANKLNCLEKENEQLKQSYKEFEDECQSTFNAMSRKQNDLYRKNFKLKEENEQLIQENKELKSILQDMGLIMSSEEVKNIRDEIASKLIKPLCEGNGFDVDVNTENGFLIIPKGVNNDRE